MADQIVPEFFTLKLQNKLKLSPGHPNQDEIISGQIPCPNKNKTAFGKNIYTWPRIFKLSLRDLGTQILLGVSD